MLGLDIRRPAAPLLVGETASITASVGPNLLDQPVRVTVTGSLSPGLAYRDVLVTHDPDCVVRAQTFSCVLLLDRGARAELRIQLLPEALLLPGTALQRLTLVSSAAPDNEMTTTLEIDDNGSEAEEATVASLAAQFLILLTLFMFALAAREAERRPHRPGD